MAKPFDAALKELIGAYPLDWARVGLDVSGPVSVVDAELSTVSADADKILRLEEPTPWLLHLELQSGADVSLDERVLRYNALIRERHRLPVHSAVFLLRPEARSPSNRGRVRYSSPGGGCEMDFRYQLVRLWTIPVERVLDAGVGALPIAPLCDTGELAMPELIQRMERRFDQEATPDEAARLWTSAYILMGLRYPPEVNAALLRGVGRMKESSTYQAIVEEGVQRGLELGRREGVQEGLQQGFAGEARRILVMLGESRLGAPDPATQARIDAESGIERLEELIKNVLTASSWDELLT